MLNNNQNPENQFNKGDINKTPRQSSGIGKSQKIIAGILAFFAVLVLGLWMAQFKKSISEPFAYKGETNTEQQKDLAQEESEEALRNKDTDNDGLTDWDELYFYNTSPYLEDSDSDGFSDKEEIDSGNDPNCPIGRDCYSVGIVDGDHNVVKEGEDTSADSTQEDSLLLDSLLDQFNVSQDSSDQEQEMSASQMQELMNILGGQADATALRQILLSAGMDEEVLNQISDEDLLKSYYEVLEE